jgi:ferredoxin
MPEMVSASPVTVCATKSELAPLMVGLLAGLIARMDAIRCTEFHQVLQQEKRWPCGICAKVCPVGEDRKLYRSTQVGRYAQERQAIQDDPEDPRYRHLVHLRLHGSGGDRIY